MTFKVEQKEGYQVLSFELDGPIAPTDLKNIELPKVDMTKGIVISGRGPVWLFGYLLHQFHPAAWVATMDPRLGGGVVVMSHTPGVAEGDIVK